MFDNKFYILCNDRRVGEEHARFLGKLPHEVCVITREDQLRGLQISNRTISIQPGTLEDEALRLGFIVYRFDDGPIRRYNAIKYQSMVAK